MQAESLPQGLNDSENSPSNATSMTKQTFRIEFMGVNTIGEAQNKWIQMMKFLREVDPPMIIHNNKDTSLPILPHEQIPPASRVDRFAIMTEIKHRRSHQAKYACVTTIETRETISTHKRENSTFIPTLTKLKVFIRHTQLKTADSVEVGFFVGMHPSLTNITWRTEQITKLLSEFNQQPPIQLYPRKLTEGSTSTSVIVVRCPKHDATQVVTQLTTLPPGVYGKQVEFIPYSIIRQTSNNSLRHIFTLQNKYILDVGAISIHGIPLETMESAYGKTKQPFHQWLLESKYVLSVEQSDSPNQNKWWILTHKDHMQQLNKHLTTTVKDIMVKIHPDPTAYDVRQSEDDQKDDDPLSPQYTSLLERLAKRTPLEEILTPNLTGRARYADIARNHNNQLRNLPMNAPPLPGVTQATESTVSSSLTTPTPPINTMIQQITDNQHTHTDKLLSDQKTQFNNLLAKQEQQTNKMVEQFQTAMKEMMSMMMKQMMDMMATILKQQQWPQQENQLRYSNPPEPQKQQDFTEYHSTPTHGHMLSTPARLIHQKIHNFRTGTRGGGRGIGRDPGQEGPPQRRPLQQTGILRHPKDRTIQDQFYDDENQWDQTYEPGPEGALVRYHDTDNGNKSKDLGGYQSTVAPRR